jgi:ABC-type transport system involved in multi-copper enzyme maturation permease subunit
MNRIIFRVEWYRWLRTRRLVALVAAFVLFGFLSLFGAKYLPDLIGHSSEIQLLRTPDWHDGLQQYVKNSGLLLAAVSMVLAAQACAVRSTDPIGIYYLSREVSPVRLYLPRILVAAAVVATAALLGAVVALYECRALFGPYPLAAALSFLAVQWFAVVLFAVFAAAVAARTGSVGLAAAVTAAVYVICLLAATAPSAQPYLPTTALQPTITTAGISATAAAKSLAALLAVAALALAAALTAPIRAIRTAK